MRKDFDREKYQPSGAWGTPTPPATLRRWLSLDFLPLPSNFPEYVFWLEHSFYVKNDSVNPSEYKLGKNVVRFCYSEIIPKYQVNGFDTDNGNLTALTFFDLGFQILVSSRMGGGGRVGIRTHRYLLALLGFYEPLVSMLPNVWTKGVITDQLGPNHVCVILCITQTWHFI